MSSINSQRLEEIEADLARMGLGIEASLASLDGAGDALFDRRTGEIIDPPTPRALALAIEWTELKVA